MANVDSVDKIISYFSCVTNQQFSYKGKKYEPKRLHVSPLLLRGFTCPAACGGCCPRFSLDYLPAEPRSSLAEKRYVLFTGKFVEIYSDMQKDHKNKKCRNLNMENGRCGIYEVRPFSCDFELIRFLVATDDEKRDNVLTQKLFGRGWAMQRIDGDRGALCEMTPIDINTVSDTIRKLKRLRDWCNHFGITDNKVDAIISWAQSFDSYEKITPLILDKEGKVV